jgi:hypothetical protein
MTATTTFADYAAAAEARKDIATAVLGHSYALCEALRQNYLQSAIKGHKRSAERGESTDYHISAIDKLRQGISPVDFQLVSGRKYYKIVFSDGGGQRSAHAFVDKKTGEIYKSASWQAPAKGVRFDLRLIKDREWLLENADWSGGYLYLR